MTIETKTVIYEGPGRIGLCTLEVPAPEPGGLLVRVTRAGVCGTDAHILDSDFPAPFPFALGHEGVGVVEEIGGCDGNVAQERAASPEAMAGVAESKRGGGTRRPETKYKATGTAEVGTKAPNSNSSRITDNLNSASDGSRTGTGATPSPVAWDASGQPVTVGNTVYWTPSHPCYRCRPCVLENDGAGCENIKRPRPLKPLGASTFTTRARLSARTQFHRVPEGTPDDAVIAFGCALPTALHGIDRSGGISPRDDVVVLGAGPVGTATAFAARLAGARRVIVVGGRQARLEAVRQFGADALIPRGTTTRAERAAHINQLLDRGGRRLVVEAAGSLAAFDEGMELLDRNARFLVMGLWAGSGTVPVDPFRISKLGLHVIGSQFAQAEHYARAVQIASDYHKRYPLEAYISHRYRLAEAKKAIMGTRGPTVLKTVLEPERG